MVLIGWDLGFHNRDDGGRDVKRIVCGAIALCLIPFSPAIAQGPTIDEVKAKIFDAKALKQTFAGGLKYCSDLNGSNFYFAQRDRVLNLDDYHRSLESLAKQQAFNAETRRPWNDKDAADRWAVAQQQATSDKKNCELVASLPELEKQLDDMEKNAAAPSAADKKN
jgi:hypothetical protein